METDINADLTCPFCGGSMELGYLYGSQTGPAHWTGNTELIGTTFDFGPVDGVMQLRSSYPDRRGFTEVMFGISHDNLALGHLCRRCGKMVIDMVPAMIHYKDPQYLDAHKEELPSEMYESETKEDGEDTGLFRKLISAFDDIDGIGEIKPAVMEVDGERGRTDTGEKIQIDKTREMAVKKKSSKKKRKYKDDEPKRRSLFGPKVE